MNVNIKETKYAFPTTRYSLIQGIYWMVFCVINSFASVYLLDKDFASGQIGLTMALAGIISVILQPLVAAASDKTPKISLKVIIITQIIIIVISAAVLLIVPLKFLGIAIFYGIMIALLQMMNPFISSLGMGFINRGVPINFGVARGMGSIFCAGLSFVFGFWVTKFGTELIPIFVIFLYLLLLINVVSFRFKVKERHFEVPLVDEIEKTGFFKGYGSFFVLLVGITGLFISHNMMNNFMMQIVSTLGGGSQEMGISMALQAMVELPTMMAFGWINRRAKSGTLLKISGIFFALKVFFTAIAGSITAVYMAQSIQMFGFALFTPAAIYYVNTAMKEKDRIKGQAFMTITATLGSVFGSLLGGYLIDLVGVTYMLYTSMGIAIIGTVIIWFSVNENID